MNGKQGSIFLYTCVTKQIQLEFLFLKRIINQFYQEIYIIISMQLRISVIHFIPLCICLIKNKYIIRDGNFWIFHTY